MTFRFFARCVLALTITAGFAAAEASPTTGPSTQPSADASNVAKSKYPNVAELIEQQRARDAELESMAQVAHFDLTGAIVEKPADFSFFGEGDETTLRSIINRLTRAKNDEKLRGVLLTFGAGTSFSLAQAQELRDSIAELRRAGKRIFVYADVYDTATYTVASAATNICMLPAGELAIPGVGVETMFYRGTMDKVGITPDFIQIGEFKGAEEPYTRVGPSEQLRGEMNKLVDALFTQIVDGIAGSRGLSRDTVRRAIDDTMVTGEQALERGFVDHLLDQDGLRTLMEGELAADVNLIDEYGEAAREPVDFSNIFALLKAVTKPQEETVGPTIALIYAEGVITDGGGEGGLFSEAGVGSERMREAFRAALKDENVRAVVIRIDSPGGSALASEVMWQAARRVADKKPVIISIGGMAASGGYYLASSGEYIFADPCAIVGSIGVVGGKFVTKDLFDKVGLTTETFARGRNADLYSSNRAWDERQRGIIRGSMQQVYEQFTNRVMTTRCGKIKDIDQVARGRIFLAPEAHSLGMVDELGGLDAALAYAAKRAELKPDGYQVIILPEPKTLADLIEGGGPSVRGLPFQPNINISADSLLLQLPPTLRRAAIQHMTMMKLLEQRAVILMTPYSITVR